MLTTPSSLTIPRQPHTALPTGVADALAAVDAAPLVALLQELVALPTGTGSAAESEGQHHMARYDVLYPLSVGTVRAGDWASSVPDLLVAEGRLGVALGEPVESARAQLEQCLADVCEADPWLREHPVRVDRWS